MQLLDNLTLQRDEVRESHRAMLQKHHQRFHHTCACLGAAKRHLLCGCRMPSC